MRIETPAGVILHTGDWKVDPNPLIGGKINSDRLKEIGDEGVLAMICDSTNVFSIGKSGSELDVRKSMVNIMSRLKKRIINRGAIVGLADGEMFVDGKKIYSAEKLKVGLFKDPSSF